MPRIVIGISASHIRASEASQAPTGARTPPMTNPAAKTRTRAGSTTSMITAALAQRKARGGSAVMLSWRNQPERRSRASCAPPPIAAPSDPYAAIEIMIMAAQLIPLPSSAVPYIRVKTTYKINGMPTEKITKLNRLAVSAALCSV